MAQQLEALAIERERVRERPHVLDQDGVAFGLEQHRGAPPVNAELWNTGLVADGVMKVSAARTSAEVRRLRAGATSRTAWVTGLPPLAWPGGHGFHGQHDLGAAGARRQRVRFTAP